MNKEVTLNWLDELANQTPKDFHEFFYDDVRNFVQGQGEEENIKSLFECKSKEEVKEWLDSITGYIVMHLDTELILDNFFSSN
jgi:hypothetical protein